MTSVRVTQPLTHRTCMTSDLLQGYLRLLDSEAMYAVVCTCLKYEGGRTNRNDLGCQMDELFHILNVRVMSYIRIEKDRVGQHGF